LRPSRQRSTLRDHGFDKYEAALAALCPVERRSERTLPSDEGF